MQNIEIRFFGKYGWGDVIYPLMYAHRIADEHDCKVILHFDWRTTPYEKYHESDSHTMAEIIDIVKKEFHVPASQEIIIKHNLNYKGEQYWTLPANTMCRSADDANLRNPKKKICVWTPNENLEHPDHRYTTDTIKDVFTANGKNKWPLMIHTLKELYPEHEIVELSYRSNFIKAMNHVKESEFCVGYYGCAISFVSLYEVPFFVTQNKKTDRHVPWGKYLNSVGHFKRCHKEYLDYIDIKMIVDSIKNKNNWRYAKNVFNLKR